MIRLWYRCGRRATWQNFEALPVPLYSMNMPAGAIIPVRGLLRLVTLMRRLRPDVVQGWMYHGNIAAQCVAPFLGERVPVLWNVRAGGNFLEGKWQTRVLVWLGGRLSYLPERIINNSTASASAHEQRYGYRVDKRLVIPNGFDTDLFKPSDEARLLVRKELGLTESALLIGLIGATTRRRITAAFSVPRPSCMLVIPTLHLFWLARAWTSATRNWRNGSATSNCLRWCDYSVNGMTCRA